MQIEFFKYQGTGNDFVVLDNRNGAYKNLNTKKINFICHRRMGIGADGLMLLNRHDVYDFEMKYYNADGREGSMCGNGGRCLVKFAYDVGITKSNYTFIAVDGIHQASIDANGIVALHMNDVNTIEERDGDFILNTGSPHYVKLMDNVMHADVCRQGQEIRYSKPFQKEGINVNFVQQLEEPDKIIVRTYERGVEDETFSCGTGVVAAALVCHHNDTGFNRVEVKTKGGNLSVEFNKYDNLFSDIWLNGPALQVYKGVVEI